MTKDYTVKITRGITTIEKGNIMSNGGGGKGWLIWIGILILFNVLSYAFGWGWILY